MGGDAAPAGVGAASRGEQGRGRSVAVEDSDAAGTTPADETAPAPEDTAPLPPFVPRERGEGESAPRRPSPLPPVD